MLRGCIVEIKKGKEGQLIEATVQILPPSPPPKRICTIYEEGSETGVQKKDSIYKVYEEQLALYLGLHLGDVEINYADIDKGCKSV